MPSEAVVIAKNAREELHIELTVFNGIDLVDVRFFTKPAVPGDEGKPTKKGLTLRPGTWREVLEALQRELADDRSE